MERTIGNLGQEIKQPSNPFANLSERSVKRCQVNILTALVANLENSDNNVKHLKVSVNLGDGYWLLRAQERTPCMFDRIIALKIISYMECRLQMEIADRSQVKLA